MTGGSPQIWRNLARRAAGPLRKGRQGDEGPWVVSEQNPSEASVLASFRLFAVLATWCEADVVGATVRNALAQGCERVYLIDNDSPDGTVEAARGAGAIVAGHFSSESYDERLRIRVMNELVQRVSAEDGADHIWWLWLDGDEFPHGPSGRTLGAYLGDLDRRFRTVGARYFNHYPGGEPTYLSGFHPLDFQPLCEEQASKACPAAHKKHPLLRYDRGAAPVLGGLGFHRVDCAQRPLREPADSVFIHHFPFRDEEVTRRRMELLCGETPGSARRSALDDERHRGGESGSVKRHRNLDAVYRGDWSSVDLRLQAGAPVGVSVAPWSESVEMAHRDVRRWYEPGRLDEARRGGAAAR